MLLSSTSLGAIVNCWRQQYGGVKAEEAKRLKKLHAEAELGKAMLKELAEGNF